VGTKRKDPYEQKKNKWLAIIIAILFVLTILNPSIHRFRTFAKADPQFCIRLHYCLIRSVYLDEFHSKKYLGVLTTFIDITPKDYPKGEPE
jgi:hypothetical protein